MDAHNALVEWKKARLNLTKAIQIYKAASTTLETACTQALYHGTKALPIDDACLELDSQSSGLVAEENSLRDTRISLLRLRNQSKRLISINAYPAEVLARIFFYAKRFCYSLGDEREFNVLAEVCSKWRGIVTTQPEMWTHIDVFPNSSLRMARVFLERSQDLPLYVHVVDRSETSAPSLHVRRVIQLLEPHMHRIHSLNFDAQGDRMLQTSMGLLLEAWAEKGPATATSLHFYRHRGKSVYYPDLVESEEGVQETHVTPSNVFSSIRTLHLEGVLFDKQNPVYRGLVDLRLHGPMRCIVPMATPLDPIISAFDIPVSLLADALAASPQIETLKLSFLNVTPEEGWHSPGPIQLEYLKVLDISGLDARSTKLVLALISQPNSSAKLSVGLTFYIHDAFEETIGFFSRSEVTAVYRKDDVEHLMLWGLPKPISHLLVSDTAVVERQSIMIQQAQEENLIPGPLNFTPIPHLILRSCMFTLEALVELIRACNTQSIVFDQCTYLGERLPDEGGEMEGLSMDGLATDLSLSCPSVQCIVLEIGPVVWPGANLFQGRI
ncbi:F-box-like protein [Ceratobasidium sp. AG-Ba]|nr:F-box-like protein [Ceratobasidium sp. AG-Ba]QRW11007.1 F-box-like protein [Ceratobasidium sp. AG-Ba]